MKLSIAIFVTMTAYAVASEFGPDPDAVSINCLEEPEVCKGLELRQRNRRTRPNPFGYNGDVFMLYVVMTLTPKPHLTFTKNPESACIHMDEDNGFGIWEVALWHDEPEDGGYFHSIRKGRCGKTSFISGARFYNRGGTLK